MNARLSRRAALGLSSLGLASCGKSEPYFGRTSPPARRSLIYEIPSEPSGLDPATATGSSDSYPSAALFEGLVSRNPQTLEPGAALATHCQIDDSLTEYTFFLRGHANPGGTKLPGAGSVRTPALWSDGRPVVAHDFVHAWQRVVDPAGGATNASALYPVVNAKEITEGRSLPEALGVRAVDELTLRVSLKAPAGHFLQLASMYALVAVPRHASSRIGSSWTAPGRMLSCGPFLLHEWKPYERIVVRKNSRYYDAGRVHLEEIVFLPITDGVTCINLYKTGSAYAMHGRAVPPLWIPALRGRKDFHAAPAYRSLFYSFNTTRPPFNNPLLRYAFHMATNKNEVTRFLGGGQTAARTVVPPFGGYQGVGTLAVEAGGRVWDVLSYDPEAARNLMSMAGAGRLVFDLTFTNRPRSKELAQILQKQWKANLGAQVNLVTMESSVWVQAIQSWSYRGMIEAGMGADYADPYTFFELFIGRIDGSGWSDPEFSRLADAANAESNRAARMRKLAACEEFLLRAMPVLPLFFDASSYLQKPYVRGLEMNALDTPSFKDVWIDTNWRPQ